MSFDWMESTRRTQGADPKGQVVQGLREKASLLKRLGYDAKYATNRCLSDLKWQFDGAQKAPLRDSDVKKLVKSIFAN